MKKYLIYFGLPLVIAVVFPFTLPTSFQVERSIELKHPQDDVFSYLVNLEAWSEWSPWLEKEPSAEYEFSGIPGVVGSFAQWRGEEIGSGKQTLTKLESPSYIETHLEFTAPQQSESTGYMKLEEHNGGVKVTWGIKGDLDGPMDRVFGLLLPSMIAPDFDKGLQNLKKKLQSQ